MNVQWVLTDDGEDQLAKALAGLITSVPTYFMVGEAGYTIFAGQEVPVNPDPTNTRLLSQGTELAGLTTFTNGSTAVTGVGTHYFTSLVINQWIKPDANKFPYSGETLGTGDGSTLTFSYTVENPPIFPASVVVTAGSVTGTDNGAGVISGSGISGTVNYQTGAISVTFSVAPALSQVISVAYTQTNLMGIWYQILSITDDTHLVLSAPFGGVTSPFGGEDTSVVPLPYFIYQQWYESGDIVFQGAGTGLTLVNNLVGLLDANETQLAVAPQFFEIGVWDNNDVLIAYGTFPEEIKTNLKILNNISNFQM